MSVNVRKVTNILDLEDISSKIMSAANLHSLNVLIKHNEALFGSIRYNSIGLVEQVENFDNQINMINIAPAPDVNTRPDANEILDTKADKTDTYSKSEDDAILLFKADEIDSYTKSETNLLLDANANVADIVDSYFKTKNDALLLLKTDKSDTYTKSETDILLDAKADQFELIDLYTKSDDDALLLLKADKTELNDLYTKSDDDALLLLKADKTELNDLYTKYEDDAILLLKVNVTDLTNYVDLTSAQTVTGQKQFTVVTTSNISNLSQNDASILLAGGGDILVSSLVTQPQLQKIRDIATGKSKVYVLSTQAELNDWMAVQENVAKLVIVDNLYIIDKEVTDYLQDVSDLKVLETELSDISIVKTTFGAATGGDNAITDISID
ncbi:MAG: hypothetical protein EZS28_031528 [Streblomastix strix]|uniref:Uncharacterized protein n=1 Tax=Streblomastix strix TaxID=222440 RepID=A0A5J4UQG3_9EUKA|nr:MAG: hypothetical protein EZS28_031528 [Streblomastix strix]